MPEPRHKIYLAGPLSGCNDDQKERWRQDFRALFGGEVEFLDPYSWGEDWVPSREMLAIEQADVVVVNMWKESIGTTIGVIRARARGKPVVLIDPNYLNHRILLELIEPFEPVRTLREARDRVHAILDRRSAKLRVRKSSGTVVDWSPDKLRRSFKAACTAGGVEDPLIPALLLSAVTRRVEQAAVEGEVRSRAIRDAVQTEFDDLATSPLQPAELRVAVRAAQEAWRKREGYKGVDQLFDEVTRRAEELEAENKALRENLAAIRASVPAADSTAASKEAEPPPKTVGEAVEHAALDFADCLVFLESARRSARDSPYGNPDRALAALAALGRYARERAAARTGGTRFPGVKEWFRKHEELCPGLDYRSREGVTTMGRYAEERTFRHAGQPVVMEQHLALGTGGPESALRVYFAPEPDGERILVGHVGRHPTNTKS